MAESAAASLQPAMTDTEVGVVRECFSKATSPAEFGSGGRTVLAVGGNALRRIRSVERHPAWIARLLENTSIVAAERAGRLPLQAVDIGPVRDDGYPLDDSARAAWPRYHGAG